MAISYLRKALKSGYSKLVESDWATVTALVGIFLLALFLRSFFGLETATADGFLLSGGSDSYYHKRVIDYVVATGHQPYIDTMLNYPIGIHSVRPPLYDWSVAVSGMIFSPLFGNVDVSVWYSFIFSTAIWGALTVFPLYFMTKEAFDKKIGLLAAFFLAIMPAHIQRSPLTNGDHDSFALFFVVLTFFFFLKAMKQLKDKEWITTWRSPRTLLANIRDFFVESRKAVLYSALAGLSIGTIALAWTGFSYVIVILLIFFIVQILINRLRNRDSFGMVVCFLITVGLGLLIGFPWYASYVRIESWFDTPFYMLVMAMIFGLVFLVTKKYPWMLVIPSVFIAFSVGLIALSFISPITVRNFFGGFGYFIQTKAYTTIAEAQAPNFSNLALSFGAVTFYLSMFGLAWSVVLIRKKIGSDYIFLVVWIALSIYMAIAAARFIFNGAPAFAITSAWIAFLVMEKLDIVGARRTYRSIGGNRFQAFRKSVKIRQVAGVLIMAFLVILPNVWFATDAAIPFEDKLEYDSQIYNTMPGPFRSENYQANRLWYLGAFGYSLPLKSRYWPTAYGWLSEQDRNIPIPSDRPAILSWWDYGFEFVQEGKHPTVADNFLDGYQLAGNFIMSQSEEDCIGLLAARLIEGYYNRYNPDAGYLSPNFDDMMKDFFARYDLDAAQIEDALKNPGNYINIVKSNPAKYGPRSPDLSANNAKYLYIRTLLTDRFTNDELVIFYQDLMETTGKSIRYFAVDTRMFPFSAQVTGIFYAPATLSDHRIESSAPIDFYEIKAVSEFGTEFPVDEVPPGTKITDYKLVYKDMFYNSMFYRTFAGYSGKDMGQAEGVPGLTENMAQQQIMPAWGLEHFRVVYRTSYYNPYPPADVQNHTEDWRAINFEDALEMQRKIQEGTANGTIDPSSRSTLSNGVVIVKYYHGAYINGTITIEGTTPFSDVTMTIQDEYGIPHYSTKTDSQGRYSVLAPFGNNLTLTASIGQVNNLTKLGATVLASYDMNITDDQAMRVPHDMDSDGILDYIITRNIQIRGGSLNGKAFVDLNGNGEPDSTDIEMSDAELTLSHKNVGTTLEGTSNATGDYEFTNIFPGEYEMTVKAQGREFSGYTATVKTGENSTLNLNITSHGLNGTVFRRTMDPIEADVFLYDETNGTTISTRSNATGKYEYAGLLHGNYTLRATLGDLSSIPVHVSLSFNKSSESKDIILYPSGSLQGLVRVENSAASHAPLKFTSYDGTMDELAYADSKGQYEVTLPAGTYSLHSSYYLAGKHYVHLSKVTVERNRASTKDLTLERSARVEGTTYLGAPNNTAGRMAITFEDMNGNGRMSAVSSNAGEYTVMLPKRNYRVKVTDVHYFMDTMILSDDRTFDILLQQGETVEGIAYYDLNKNEVPDNGEGIDGVNMVLMDSKSRRIDVYADSDGTYAVTLDGEERYSVTIGIGGYEPYASGFLSVAELREGSNIRLTPSNVTLSGVVTFEDTPVNDQVTIRFVPRSMGAIEAVVTTMPNPSGTYEVALMPGEYEVSIDHGIAPGEKLVSIDKSIIEIKIGDEDKVADIELVRKFQLTGNVVLEGVDPSEFVETFVLLEGPEDAQFSGNATFSVFLTEGVYSMKATVFYNENYQNISRIDMSAPTEMDFELEPTAEVKGLVQYNGAEIGDPMVVVFEKSTGGSTTITTSASGEYTFILPVGEYIAEVNHTKTETDGAQRFVRYLASAQVTLPEGGSIDLNMNLVRVLNNATVAGKVYDSGNTTIAADLEFVAIDDSAINTTVTSKSNGDFAMTLHPGNYTLYVVHGKDAYLSNVSAFAEQTKIMNIRLQKGVRLEGTIYKGLTPVSGELTVEDHSKGTRILVESEANGKFNLTLPAATYTINSSSVLIERGIEVPYSNHTTVELKGDKIIKVELEKKSSYDVDISWNPSERRKIHGNETVVYTVIVSNTGNVPDSYRMAGRPVEWRFEFTPLEVPMNYGDTDSSRAVEVRITAPPFALVNHETIQVVAMSRNSSKEAMVDLEVEIYPYLGVELGVSNETPVYNNTRMKYVVEITNTGNDEDNYTLLIANRDEIELKGWKAYFNSSGVFADSTTVAVSPNVKTTIEVELDAGHDTVNLMILAYSEKDRGTDDVLSIQVSLPRLLLEKSDVGVEGERLTLTPPDNLMANALIAMVFATIVCIIALFVVRRKKK